MVRLFVGAIRYLYRTFREVAKSPGAGISLIVLGGIVILALFARQVSPYDPYETYVGESLDGPSAGHLFGLDFLGRDLFSRILFGARLSLFVGILATMFSIFFGSAFGIVAGYYGGIVDFVLSRIIDFWLGFPSIVFALVVITILGKGLTNVALAVGIASIPRLARVVRGSVLSVKESVYVEASRAVGSHGLHIMAKHILPNVVAPIIVLGSLQIGVAVINAASLNFLGLGASPPTAEWGLMLSESQTYMRYAPWTMLAPGIALFLFVMSANLLGDRVREIMDPRIRRSRG